MSASEGTESSASGRLESIDLFRGFTIFLMILVIAVAAGGYKDLPQRGSWFGSLPVSTWNHAEVGWEEFVEQRKAEGLTDSEILKLPEARLKNVGCTVTDLVAPWFVLVVGMCIPLSRVRRGKQWRNRVISRTLMLIAAGVVYISLILSLSYWWGILQAIGVAYLMAALAMRLPLRWRLAAILVIAIFHTVMSRTFGWWLHFGDGSQPFWSVTNISGDWRRPLTIHCRPWVSVSYGVMAMIGTLLGEALATRDNRRITTAGASLALVFGGVGLATHQLGLMSGHTWLCFNKSDVTSSYAFFASGLGALVFLLFHHAYTAVGMRGWMLPLNVLGRNALLAYFMQIIMRLAFRALGLEPFFSGSVNDQLNSWASLCSSPHWKAFLLDKTGYNGLLWGLLWTVCLWLIIAFCNRRGWVWKL
ncbi:MAG: DUF1624 domain-containing protein [Armatimonadetes bacterium]|nr:DUF1624 domain-containing protein [Armatimonadota bacterium]